MVSNSTIFCIRNSGLRKIKYSSELTPVKIHELILLIEHTQHLRSNSWLSYNYNLVRKFKIQRQIENSGLQVHNISFTTQNRTNSRKFFCFLFLTFLIQKTWSDPTLFFMMNRKHSRYITIKYSCKLTPVKIHKS